MEVKDLKRNLVQSTLFHRSDSSIKGGENCDGDRGEYMAEQEQECGGSRKRTGSKRDCNSKSKTMPRASPKKIIENGKGTSSYQVDENGSSVINKSSFFVETYEWQNQKRQQEHPVLMDSPIDNEKISSPPSSRANARSTPRKLKRRDNITPRKERRNLTPNKKMKNVKGVSCCKQIPFGIAVDEQQLQTIPDLRLEAKLSAEENSRIFSGKQIHPFFASWKRVKSSRDLTDSENKWSHGRKKEDTDFNLIHVFEDVEGDLTTLDWGDWVFSESKAIDGLDYGCSSVYEGSVDSLNFDNFLNLSNSTRTSLYQSSHLCSVPEKVVRGFPNNKECSHIISPLLIFDGREACIDQQKHSDILPKDAEYMLDTSVETMLQDHILEIKSDFCGGVPFGGSLESELQNRLLEERIMSHYDTSQTKNCLWTDRYQPQNAKQICGNGEPVKSLSEWLRLWHKRGSLTSSGCNDGDYSIVQDTDPDYQQNGSDTGSGEENLKNVLLVTGPVGSGKSAAIYACARDQGFQIIEINASDWRNGALIKQKFGEAVESHWLQCTVENATQSDNKSASNFLKAVNEKTHCSDDEVIEVISLLDQKDSLDTASWPNLSVSGSSQPAKSQSVTKTLILFEDVDATLHEDHGFIAAIQHLSETAKRPMILTTNSDKPVLPKNLDRLELSFSVPSVQELLRLASMICGAEKANIHPCLIERFVNYCQGDIRRTIMLLQFWCQGQTPVRGNELHAKYWPLLFDIDAGHRVLPRVIHQGFPSHLSDLVADEVNKSLTLMEEETHGLMDINIVQDLTGSNKNEVKKAVMLSHCSLDEVECVQSDIFNESKLYPTTVSYGHFTDTTGDDICIFQDLDSILGPFIGSQPTESCHIKEMPGNDFDIRSCVDQEEIWESLSKSEVDILGGYQPLDECSRVDFMRTLEPPLVNSKADFVKETWKNLHNQCTDLSKYVTAEERTICQALVYGHRMSDLISEADLLLRDCQALALDSLGPCEKPHSHTYYDDQLEMSSVLAQHGMCFYAKEIASLGSVVGSTNISSLASEMLLSSESSVAFGKLASQDQRKFGGSDDKTTTKSNLLTSKKSGSCLSSILRSIVPSRSYLSVKGVAFHEYTSTLSQISRYEDSRLSECTKKKQSRARAPRHYLSSGRSGLSSAEISLLRQYSNCYQANS